MNNLNDLLMYICYHDNTIIYDKNNYEYWFYGPSGILNQCLSEYSMFYWIWKNDKTSKYIGVSHYRRKIKLAELNIENINENSCIVYNILYGDKSNPSAAFGLKKFCDITWLNVKWLYNDYVNYTVEKYGKNNNYLITDDLVFEKREFINRSVGIFTRLHFMNMCDYIFGFLYYIDNKYQLNFKLNNYKQFIDTHWAYSNIQDSVYFK